VTEKNFYRFGALIAYCAVGIFFMFSRDLRDILVNTYLIVTTIPFALTYIIYVINSSKSQKATSGLYLAPIHFAIISIPYALTASLISSPEKDINTSLSIGLKFGLFSALLGIIFGYLLVFSLRSIAKILFLNRPLTRR
jgi:hypothetical protein